MLELPIDVQALLERHAALEVEALAALSPSVACDAVPRWFYAQERTPYWLNRLVTLTDVDDYAEDAGDEGALDEATVEMFLVYAPSTSGMEGEVEAAMNAALPQLVAYFRRRAWLQTAAFPDPLPYLRSAVIALAQGSTLAPPTPDGTQRVGMLFRSVCRFITPIDQEWLG
jgi:hypothetical protein